MQFHDSNTSPPFAIVLNLKSCVDLRKDREACDRGEECHNLGKSLIHPIPRCESWDCGRCPNSWGSERWWMAEWRFHFYCTTTWCHNHQGDPHSLTYLQSCLAVHHEGSLQNPSTWVWVSHPCMFVELFSSEVWWLLLALLRFWETLPYSCLFCVSHYDWLIFGVQFLAEKDSS